MEDSKHGGMKLADLTKWQLDKAWADEYVPAIRAVVDRIASKIINIQIATEQDDQENATDYIITIDAGKIACRVRRSNCGFRDLTIRAWRSSGAKTELNKIKEGFARWYLYAWANEKHGFCDWILVNLDRLRESGLLLEQRKLIYNKDGTTAFITITLTELIQHNALVHRG
jgi:hypothetical protein